MLGGSVGGGEAGGASSAESSDDHAEDDDSVGETMMMNCSCIVDMVNDRPPDV